MDTSRETLSESLKPPIRGLKVSDKDQQQQQSRSESWMESDSEGFRRSCWEFITQTVSALNKHTGGRRLTKQLPARFTNQHIFQPLLAHLAGGINEKKLANIGEEKKSLSGSFLALIRWEGGGDNEGWSLLSEMQVKSVVMLKE